MLVEQRKDLFHLRCRVGLFDKGAAAVHDTAGKTAVYAVDTNVVLKVLGMAVDEANEKDIAPQTVGKIR
jgi:hypothetical protein